MSYPFVASRYRGPVREGPTLGVLLHMAEGGNTVHYLAGDPARGVSVHFVIEYTGRIVQMLNWNERAGTLNPRDRSSDKRYYGHSHLVDVLGNWWTNPNHALIQVEMEGFARTGPNVKQRAAVVALVADITTRFPSVRGALGHADQTDTKACPGTTDAMKSVFAAIGGHGLWTEEDVPGLAFTMTDPTPGRLKSKNLPGQGAIQLADWQLVVLPPNWEGDTFGKGRCDEEIGGSGTREGYLIGDELAVIPASQVDFTPDTLDCSGPIGAQRERDRVAALAAVEEVYAQ